MEVAARSPKSRPVELKGVTLNTRIPVNHETMTSHNVLAKIPCKTRLDEIVMIGAQWGAYGEGKPDVQGRIYRAGANDDALGIAGMFKIARAMKA